MLFEALGVYDCGLNRKEFPVLLGPILGCPRAVRVRARRPELGPEEGRHTLGGKEMGWWGNRELRKWGVVVGRTPRLPQAWELDSRGLFIFNFVRILLT